MGATHCRFCKRPWKVPSSVDASQSYCPKCHDERVAEFITVKGPREQFTTPDGRYTLSHKIIFGQTTPHGHLVLTVGQRYGGKLRNPPSIFLAGPIERVEDGQPRKLPRWRNAAIQLLLNEEKEPLVLYTPEWNTKPEGWTYEKQLLWEVKHLNTAHIILFWIPRSEDLPAFTTNIEFGENLHSGRIVVGSPPEASHIRYLQTRCKLLDIPWHTTLGSCCHAALEMLHALS